MNSPFNWTNLISEMTDSGFGIQPDVTFRIVEDGEIKEVRAHKMILGMVSPMFKKMFFTTDVGDKTAEKIDIKETTLVAFEVMIDAIYNTKSIEDSLKGKSVQEFFDVINLIERYQIAELQKIIKKYVYNYPISGETVLDVAAEAMEYSHLFQTEAQYIILKCAKLLKPKLSDATSIMKYISENMNHKDVVSTLITKIYDNFEKPCPNCSYKKENCQNGKEVKADELKTGILVRNNKDKRLPSNWRKFEGGTAKVTLVTDTHIQFVSIKAGVSQTGLNGKCFQIGGSAYYKVSNEISIPLFLFSCK